MSPPPDPQKAKLYAWEDSWWGWDRNLVTLRKCREVIRRACSLYGIKPPVVTQHFTTDMSWSMPYAENRRIALEAGHSGKGGLNYPIALHEVAHQIIWDYYGRTVQDHGQEFVGVYLWLLAEAGIAPEAALVASADSAGLQWEYGAPDGMPPKPVPVQRIVGEVSQRLLR